VKKNCSFFYLDPVLGKDISSKFRGISVNGRAIRVNEDTDGPPRDSKKQKNRNREFGFEKRNRRKERARPPRKGRRR
jgi:hypothetical protein